MTSPDSVQACPACGHGLAGTARSCSRCGRPVGSDDQKQDVLTSRPQSLLHSHDVNETRPIADPSIDTAAFEATTNRSALHTQMQQPMPVPLLEPATVVAPTNVTRTDGAETAWAGPVPDYPAAAGPDYASSTTPPPEVILVGIGLLVVGGFLLYPFCRYGFPLVGDLTDSNEFARAFAAIVTYVLVLFAATGVALVLLAIGLFRRSHVAQVLTCLVSAVIVVAEALNSPSDSLAASTSTTTERGVVVVVSLGVIALLLIPNARRFFASDVRSAFGVDLAIAVSICFGVCAAINGLLLVIFGVLDEKYVWFGLGLAAAGLLVLSMSRPLRGGRAAVRATVSLAYIGYVILGFVIAHQTGNAGSPTAVVPLLIALIALAALWLVPSSQELFANPSALPDPNPLAVGGLVLLVVISGIGGGIGFHAASKQSSFAAYPVPADTYQPEQAEPVDVQTSPTDYLLDSTQAEAAVTTMFEGMQTSSEVSTCDGDLDSLDVSNYSIGEVTPETQGSFRVSAGVTMTDGTEEFVTVTLGVDSKDNPCIEDNSLQSSANVLRQRQGAPSPAFEANKPDDVPSVPTTGDPVPTDASLPAAPTGSHVLAYDDAGIPTRARQLVEYRPNGLGPDEAAAVANVITLMTRINQQNFGAAWPVSTDSLVAPAPSAVFRHGCRTSRSYQVAFGQPQRVASDLIVIPAQFVSRQDPSAQGDPSGVTDCSYWPQYVFVVARPGGRWLDDVAGKYGQRSDLDQFRRASDGGTYLNPLAHRVAC